VTFNQDVWLAVSSRRYLDQDRRSRSQLKVRGQKRKISQKWSTRP